MDLNQPEMPEKPDLPVGAHLVTPRRGYLHHGIYLGEGRVAHYAGFCRFGRRGPVEIVALARFAGRYGFRVAVDRGARYFGLEVVERALGRIGEDGYSVLHNNCEHFCLWCITGVARSEQVERVRDVPRRIAAAVMRAVIATGKRHASLNTLNAPNSPDAFA